MRLVEPHLTRLGKALANYDAAQTPSSEEHLIAQLFDAEEWDVNAHSLTLSQATLLRDLGPFKSGQRFDQVHVLYETSDIQLERDDMFWVFDIGLRIGQLQASG